jgi:hypothetical protein
MSEKKEEKIKTTKKRKRRGEKINIDLHMIEWNTNKSLNKLMR